MKNLILLFLFCLFCAQALEAQENNSIKFGVRIGLNLSHIDFSKGSPPPETAITTNLEPGIVAGLVVKVRLYKNFYFQPEYLFSQMGGEIKATKTLYKINYFSLPVFLKWEFRRLFFTIGPQFDLLINSERDVEGSVSSGPVEMEERSIGITAGIGWHLWNSIGIEARYMKGFNHIGLLMDPGLQEFKYEMVQLSVYYLF